MAIYLRDNMQSVTWNQVQTMDIELSREAIFRMETVLAMVRRRHGISLEQSHAKGKSAKENAETAAAAREGDEA